MNKPKYLKLLAIVEEDYKTIGEGIQIDNDSWHCDNVLSIKLNDDFSLIVDDELEEFLSKFIYGALADARKKSNK